MQSVVYTSSSSFPFSDEDLATLLMNSRVRNAQSGLTGILLHRNGQFMQVLEGPADAVAARFAVIAADPRHAKVDTLLEEPISTRRFPNWTMGYQAVTDDLVDLIPGYDDFFAAGGDRKTAPGADSAAHDLLKWFRDLALFGDRDLNRR